MNAQPIFIPANQRLVYNPLAHVERPGVDGNPDRVIASIYGWVQQRLNGGAKPIFRLEAPPGFGKTWSLERFVELHGRDWSDNLVIMGPLTPPVEYTLDWWWEQVTKHLLQPNIYAIQEEYIRPLDETNFQGCIFSLINGLGSQSPLHHLLFIVDDIDQAPDPDALEMMLLSPIANHFTTHAVSLLLALRHDYSFRTEESLRSARRYHKELVPPFDKAQAEQQVSLLLQVLGVQDQLQSTARTIVSMLPGAYTWGIPSLNAKLVLAGFSKLADADLLWRVEEVEDCILLALRLDPTKDREFLRTAMLFCRKSYPHGWHIDDVRTKLNCGETDASKFRNRLKNLNLFEHPAIIIYQFSQEWNSIFEVCHDLRADTPDSTRGQL